MKIKELLQDNSIKDKKALKKIISNKFGWTQEEFYKYINRHITKKQKNSIIKQYNKHKIEKKPIEYIIGYCNFYDLNFKVNKNVLIPRPESEYILKHSKNQIISNKNNILIDIGTGTGCLGISANYYFQKFINKTFLVDTNQKILNTAEKNKNNILGNKNNIKIIKSNLLEFLKEEYIGDYNIIIYANLPYIPDDIYTNETEKKIKLYEPKNALEGGKDGLYFYKKLLNQIIELNIKNNTTLYFELFEDQINKLAKKFLNNFNFYTLSTFHDKIKILKITNFS